MDKNKLIKVGISIIAIILIILGFNFYNKNISNKKQSKDYIIYDADAAIKKALEEIERTTEKSEVVSDVSTSENVISINFIGLATSESNDIILDTLSENNIKSIFFVPGIQAAEDSDIFEKLEKSGHKIGSNGLFGEIKMEEYDNKDLIESFIRTNEIIQKWTHKNESILLYCNSTEYTDDLLKAAYVSGNETLVESKYILNYRSFKSYEETLAYIRKIPAGSIITIKLAGELDDTEYEQNEKPAEDLQGTIIDNPMDEFDEEERLIMVVQWIIKAIKELNYETVFSDELKEYGETNNSNEGNYSGSNGNITGNISGSNSGNNSGNSNGGSDYLTPVELDQYFTNKATELKIVNNGKQASTQGKIYTVQPAVGYSFYGISNTVVLDDVLSKLKENDIKATFFITEKDIEKNENEIKQIVDNGHELEIMLVEQSGSDYLSVAKSILRIQRYIKSNFNQEAFLVRYPYEVEYSDEALEAISATGCKVSGQNLSVATSKVGKDGTLDQIANNIFHQGNIALNKGFVVYFRMDYYNDTTIIGQLIEKIKKEKVDTIGYIDNGIKYNGYSFETVGNLVSSKDVFTYPLSDSEILPTVLNKIRKGYLNDVEDKTDYISKRYIGSPFAKGSDTLPGFTDDEINVLDSVGRFTDDKTIFLSFDDWGSDIAISKLLYVLDKYDVKVTFFIRTNYINENPALLRTIALAGHDIASHSDNHLLLSNTTENKGVFTELTDEEAQVLQDDVILSYEKLQRIVGDIYIDGRTALQPYFRPPTLAVSKKGLTSIFDSGFTYSVSGDFTTQDYEAESAAALIDKLKYGFLSEGSTGVKITSGSVLIMHMSDEAKFTAEALDTVIPYYLSQGYTFGRLSDYLK